MALRLEREDGLFAGTSLGANLVAAIRVAETLGPEATVVTIMVTPLPEYRPVQTIIVYMMI